MQCGTDIMGINYTQGTLTTHRASLAVRLISYSMDLQIRILIFELV